MTKEFKGMVKTKEGQIGQLLEYKIIIDNEERCLVLLDVGIVPFKEDDIEPILE